MKKNLYLFCVSLLILSSGLVYGQGSLVTVTDSIIVTPSVGTGADVTIASGTPSCDSTGSDILIADWTVNGNPRVWRTYMKFDLSGIPSGAIIQSATLYLFADSTSPLGYTGQPTYGTNNQGEIYRVTGSWTKSTLSFANQPTTTTVNSVTIPQSTSMVQNYTLNVKDMVSDWLTINNYGCLIKHTQEISYYNSMIFHSSRSLDSNLRPALKIVYTDTVQTGDTTNPDTTSGIYTVVNNAGHTVSLYPNPSDNVLKTDITKAANQTIVIKLVDISGRILSEAKDKSNANRIHLEFNTADYAKGVYFIKVEYSNGSILVNQFIH